MQRKGERREHFLEERNSSKSHVRHWRVYSRLGIIAGAMVATNSNTCCGWGGAPFATAHRARWKARRAVFSCRSWSSDPL